MAAHSRIGASSMYRWRACPGSVALSAGMPNPTTVYAAEGSVAHAWAERKLRALMAGRGATQTDDWKVGDTQVYAGHAIELSAEMQDAVDLYVHTVWSHAQKPRAELRIEQRLDLSEIHPGMFGTSDAVVIEPGKVTVYDYKHGAGIAVDAEDNEQMQFYAVGTLLNVHAGVLEIEVAIVQPRAFHAAGPVRRWSFPAVQILDFIADMKAAAAATEQPDAPRAAGDHCRFCLAQPICPTLKDHAMKIAQSEFPPVDARVVDGVPVPRYDADALNEILRAIPAIEAWATSVKTFARAEAMAGRGSSGHKLVRGRASREIVNPEALKQWLQLEVGVAESQLYHPPEFKSPSQIEDIRNPDGSRALDPESKKQMNTLYIRKQPGNLVLVPIEDKREAVSPRDEAQAEFTAITL